jgi:hypothetical protein
MWRKLHIEELNDLYSSPDIIRTIKSRKIRGAEDVVHIGERRGASRVFVGKLWERDVSEDPGVDWNIILR